PSSDLTYRCSSFSDLNISVFFFSDLNILARCKFGYEGQVVDACKILTSDDKVNAILEQTLSKIVAKRLQKELME
nr:hypothetical protein [Tanacetum cinerariifolium]